MRENSYRQHIKLGANDSNERIIKIEFGDKSLNDGFLWKLHYLKTKKIIS